MISQLIDASGWPGSALWNFSCLPENTAVLVLVPSAPPLSSFAPAETTLSLAHVALKHANELACDGSPGERCCRWFVRCCHKSRACYCAGVAGRQAGRLPKLRSPLSGQQRTLGWPGQGANLKGLASELISQIMLNTREKKKSTLDQRRSSNKSIKISMFGFVNQVVWVHCWYYFAESSFWGSWAFSSPKKVEINRNAQKNGPIIK